MCQNPFFSDISLLLLFVFFTARPDLCGCECACVRACAVARERVGVCAASRQTSSRSIPAVTPIDEPVHVRVHCKEEKKKTWQLSHRATVEIGRAHV